MVVFFWVGVIHRRAKQGLATAALYESPEALLEPSTLVLCINGGQYPTGAEQALSLWTAGCLLCFTLQSLLPG